MDFIKQLPESKGFTDILVVMDRLTKQAIFISTQRLIDVSRLIDTITNGYLLDLWFEKRVLQESSSKV